MSELVKKPSDFFGPSGEGGQSVMGPSGTGGQSFMGPSGEEQSFMGPSGGEQSIMGPSGEEQSFMGPGSTVTDSKNLSENVTTEYGLPRLGDARREEIRLEKLKRIEAGEDVEEKLGWKTFYDAFSFIPGVNRSKLFEKLVAKEKGEEVNINEQDADDLLGQYVQYVQDVDVGLKSGVVRAGFSFADIALAGLNVVTEKSIGKQSDLQEKVNDLYFNLDIEQPETFIGDLSSILAEYGLPAKKIQFVKNRAFKLLGINSLTSSTKIPTVARKIGNMFDTGLVVGLTDYVASGPDAVLPFRRNKIIDTTNLTGKELTDATLKNRVLYGEEGTIIGAGIPLVGPALKFGAKYGLYKPAKIVGGVTARTYDTMFVTPASLLFSKIPPNILVKPITGAVSTIIKETGSGILKPFINVGVKNRKLFDKLPDYKEWSLFTVQQGGVEKRLKYFDNLLSSFRGRGKNTKQGKFLERESESSIKATNKNLNKLLEDIQNRSYKLVDAYKKKIYDTSKSSPADLEYLNEMIIKYLKGESTAIPKELRPLVKVLKRDLDLIKTNYAKLLPEKELKEFRDYILKDASAYFIKSFKLFTNPNYTPNPIDKQNFKKFMIDKIIDPSEKKRLLNEYGPFKGVKKINELAEVALLKILATGKTNGKDPLKQMQFISNRILNMRGPGEKIENIIKTGEELPDVIKKLLGEEPNTPKNMILTTVTDMITAVENRNKFKNIIKAGLEEGLLFKNQSAAKGRVVYQIGSTDFSNKGISKYPEELAELWATQEVKDGFIKSVDTGLDNSIGSAIIQTLLAGKVAAQFAKTVFSPATQVRNVSSAGLFSFNAGHFGGSANLDDALRIILDDVGGIGKYTSEKQVKIIKNLERAIELGVLDENIVTTELSSVLKDINDKNLTGLTNIINKLSNNKVTKTATQYYAAGDNLWRWFGWQYVQSELHMSLKSVDEVAKYMDDMFDYKFNKNNKITGNKKLLFEAIEEAAGMEVKIVYPTYSAVPEFVQSFRRIPVAGNFVSFPAAMIQATVGNLDMSMRLINSKNSKIRQKGYKKLISSITNLAVVAPTAAAVSYKLTGMTKDMIMDWKENIGPDYLRQAEIMPVSKVKNGIFKYYNFSGTYPFGVVTQPVKQLFKLLTENKNTPENVKSNIINSIFNPFNKDSPFNSIFRSYFGSTIYTEMALDIVPKEFGGRGGINSRGGRIWSDTDSTIDVTLKGFFHLLRGLAPGLYTSGERIFKGFAGSTVKDPYDELLNLFTGVRMSTANIPESFEYIVNDLKKIPGEVFQTEKFYTKENFRLRGPEQMAKDFQQIQDEAYIAQYKIYQSIETARKFGLSDRTLRKILMKRKFGKIATYRLLKGDFVPTPYSVPAFNGKLEKLEEYQKNSGDTVFTEKRNKDYFYPRRLLDDIIKANKDRTFITESNESSKENKKSNNDFLNMFRDFIPSKIKDDFKNTKDSIEDTFKSTKDNIKDFIQTSEIQTPPLNTTTENPTVSVASAAPNVNPTTNLTKTEEALLSPTDKIIRQNQRTV